VGQLRAFSSQIASAQAIWGHKKVEREKKKKPKGRYNSEAIRAWSVCRGWNCANTNKNTAKKQEAGEMRGVHE